MKLEYRTLNYKDASEVRAFLTLLYDISAELDPYHFEKSHEFIDRAVIKARREETSSNTFAAMAIARSGQGAAGKNVTAESRGAVGGSGSGSRTAGGGPEIVGLHVLRRIEEGPWIGAHSSGLWVAVPYRRRGIARHLKLLGERWARSIGAAFVSTNVLTHNAPMLELNRQLGFEPYRIQLRKRL